MTYILCFDTESTGLPDHKAPSDHPDQPHLVEIGAILYDVEAGMARATFSMIVQPTWQGEVPEEALRIHGISSALAARVGVPLNVVVRAFAELMSLGDLTIAYNAGHDRKIMKTAWLRSGGAREGFDNTWRPDLVRDIARRATSVCQMPPTEAMKARTSFKFKTPKLIEAYPILFGESFKGAHGALQDCRAALRVWNELERRERGDTGQETAQPAERSALPASAGGDVASQGAASSPAPDQGAA